MIANTTECSKPFLSERLEPKVGRFGETAINA